MVVGQFEKLHPEGVSGDQPVVGERSERNHRSVVVQDPGTPVGVPGLLRLSNQGLRRFAA
jgi:hypothetical protein